jgi:D-3-phosphoglycerate dehydrogenase
MADTAAKNILITTSAFAYLQEGRMASLPHLGLHAIFNPFKRKLTEAEVISLLDAHDPVGLIAGVEPLTRRALQSARNLKIISRCGAGLDSVDLEAARDLGIAVAHTPDAPTIPVAELTVAAMLCVLRHIHVTDAAIRQARWERPMGSLLHKKTVGIVGCGRIGAHVAKLLQGFECRVLGHDLAHANGQALYEEVGLDELLSQADIVTLHLPHTPDSHHLLDRKKLRLLKKDAILINAARGGLVDERALCEALQAGQLAGAALDTFEEEPYRGPLRELNNVLLTAHIGSYAREARVMMEQQAWENLLAGLPKGEIRK